MVSYDGSSVSGSVGTNAGTSGGSRVSVLGGGFGSVERSVGVRVGGSVCSGSVEWVSLSSVVCLSSSGVFGRREAVLSAGAQVGSVSGVVSYDGVVVSGVERSNVGGSGGGSVTVANPAQTAIAAAWPFGLLAHQGFFLTIFGFFLSMEKMA